MMSYHIEEAKYFNHTERQHQTFSVFSIYLSSLSHSDLQLFYELWREASVKHSWMYAACELSKLH